MPPTSSIHGFHSIDADAIRRQFDMADVVERELGRAPRRGSNPQWRCPFHAETGPSFTAYRDHAHCFGCGWHGDVIKWTMERQGVGFVEACRILGGMTRERAATKPVSINGKVSKTDMVTSMVNTTAHTLLPEVPSDEWQDAAMALVVESEVRLWDESDPVSQKVRDYLTRRGLSEAMLQGHFVGYNPSERNIPEVGLWVPAGMTIPLWHPNRNTLYGVNVRLSREARKQWKQQTGRDSKYVLAKGSKRAPLGLESIFGKSHVFVVEGEFDYMLTLQKILDMRSKGLEAGVLTMGAASSRDIEKWLLLYPVLLEPRRYLIATDTDGAGQQAARYWLERTKRARLYPPPASHKDVTEFWQRLGDEAVYRWIQDGLSY